MPRINLLPWREEQRRERKLTLLVGLGGAAVAAAVATFAAYLVFVSMIDGQKQRNDSLRAEIKVLDSQIEEINSLESAKQKFIARMDIIEKLQRSRPEIVRLFDEIVRTIPEGTFLTGVKQTDKKLKFDGVAQSSTRVSTFMRNIDGSQWMRNPELEVIENKTGTGIGPSFILFAEQVSRVGEVKSDVKEPGKPGKPGAKPGSNRVVAQRKGS
jgi:type IV pilus assembly protein PilN